MIKMYCDMCNEKILSGYYYTLDIDCKTVDTQQPVIKLDYFGRQVKHYCFSCVRKVEDFINSGSDNKE